MYDLYKACDGMTPPEEVILPAPDVQFSRPPATYVALLFVTDSTGPLVILGEARRKKNAVLLAWSEL